eukprot:6192050-Pleurochrysis_carterae.AAC.5
MLARSAQTADAAPQPDRTNAHIVACFRRRSRPCTRLLPPDQWTSSGLAKAVFYPDQARAEFELHLRSTTRRRGKRDYGQARVAAQKWKRAF